jgi:hypothetical protein
MSIPYTFPVVIEEKKGYGITSSIKSNSLSININESNTLTKSLGEGDNTIEALDAYTNNHCLSNQKYLLVT